MSITYIYNMLKAPESISGDDAIEHIIFDVCAAPPVKSDVAVVLGCDEKSSLLRARFAADFFNNGYAEYIIASGGVLRNHGGEKRAECDIMGDRLIECGVPEDRIIRERASANTIGNMVFSLGVMCERGFLERGINRITVITEPYHLARSLLLARTYMPDFIDICGFTENAEEQRSSWNKNQTLRKKVDNEIFLLKDLAANKRVSVLRGAIS